MIHLVPNGPNGIMSADFEKPFLALANLTIDDRLHMDENFSWIFDDVLKDYKDSLFMHRKPKVIGLICSYVIIFLMAMTGNLMVLVVILSYKSMRNVTNFFLLNLALADLLVTLVCIPLTVGEIIYKEWIYGLFLCKTASYLQGVSVAASVLTIMALSLDRYIAIQHPVKSRRISTTGHVKKVIICIWVIACSIMVPLIIVRHLTVHPIDPLYTHQTLTFCHENWPQLHSRKVFDVFLFVFIYVVPGIMVVFSYSTTGCHLLMGTNRLHRQDSDIHQSNKVVAGRRRVARMLLLLAVLFAVSWMPYYIVVLVMDFTNSQETNQYLPALSFALLLGHSHSAQNPVLYCFMNTNFRRTILGLLRCRRLLPNELSRTELHRPDGIGSQRLSYRARHRSYGGVELLPNRSVSSSPSHASVTSPLRKQTFWPSTRSRPGSVRSVPPRILLLSSQDSLNNGTHSDDSAPNSPWYKQTLSRQLSEGATSNESHPRPLAAIYESNGQCISIVEASQAEDETQPLPGAAV